MHYPHYHIAPAKVNLSLKLLGRRPDGFTGIETLIVPLDLADTLSFVPDGGGPLLECSDPSLPVDESNLVLRAALAFDRRIPGGARYKIHLEKRIPHGAGLGGGSSDAAATLLALNHLNGRPISDDNLAVMAATLGSDVPVFLCGGAAFCSGRGEIIRPLRGADAPPPLTLLLVKPPFPVSTAWAYKKWAELRGTVAETARNRQFAFGIELFNDLEAPVFGKHLILEIARDWLKASPGVAAALMSGSGSTLFALLDCPSERAAALQAAFHKEFGGGWWSAICRWISPDSSA